MSRPPPKPLQQLYDKYWRMGPRDRSADEPGVRIAQVLAALTDRQTYKNVLYLVLAFPLGLLFTTVLVFGFVFGLLLTVVVVGVGVLIGTVVAARGLADVERRVANALLTVNLRDPADLREAEGALAEVRRYLEAPSTWRGLGFLVLKFWLGVVGLVLLAVLIGAGELLTAPLRYPLAVELGTLNGRPVAWVIDTALEAVLAVPVGALLALVALNLANGFAYVAQRMAIALLDGSPASDGQPTST